MTTSLESWLGEAKEIIKPIIQGSELTNRYQEVEKESMRSILESVDRLVQHLDDMPDHCDCHSSNCPNWDDGRETGYAYGHQDAREDAEAAGTEPPDDKHDLD